MGTDLMHASLCLSRTLIAPPRTVGKDDGVEGVQSDDDKAVRGHLGRLDQQEHVVKEDVAPFVLALAALEQRDRLVPHQVPRRRHQA
jgi:hypothetical protein